MEKLLPPKSLQECGQMTCLVLRTMYIVQNKWISAEEPANPEVLGSAGQSPKYRKKVHRTCTRYEAVPQGIQSLLSKYGNHGNPEVCPTNPTAEAPG